MLYIKVILLGKGAGYKRPILPQREATNRSSSKLSKRDTRAKQGLGYRKFVKLNIYTNEIVWYVFSRSVYFSLINDTHEFQLQRVQNCLARVVLLDQSSPATSLLSQLHWLLFPSRSNSKLQHLHISQLPLVNPLTFLLY